MAGGSTIRTGVVRGRTIECDSDLGLPEGQAVSVTVAPVDASVDSAMSDGLRRAFGALSAEAEVFDAYLAWTREQRKAPRRDIQP